MGVVCKRRGRIVGVLGSLDETVGGLWSRQGSVNGIPDVVTCGCACSVGKVGRS